MLRTSADSVTSTCRQSASPPESFFDATVSLAPARSMSAMTTLARRRAKASAVARPMPDAPPVITTTLPIIRSTPQLGIHVSFGRRLCSRVYRHRVYSATRPTLTPLTWSMRGKPEVEPQQADEHQKAASRKFTRLARPWDFWREQPFTPTNAHEVELYSAKTSSESCLWSAKIPCGRDLGPM